MTLFFIFGLFWGSFINNVAYRLVRKEKFLGGRSKCPLCYHTLKWYELIPIISFILQRGKCNYCKKNISLRYPLSELITGFFCYFLSIKIFTYFSFEEILIYLFYLSIFSIFFILALYDYETLYIEEKFIYFAIACWLFFILLFYFFKVEVSKINFSNDFDYLFYLPELTFKDFVLNRLYFSLIYSLIFIVIFILTLGKGIGLGDARWAFVLGLYFNFSYLIFSFLISIFLGGILSIILLLKFRKTKIPVPFLPILFSGFLVNLIFGDMLYNLILSNIFEI